MKTLARAIVSFGAGILAFAVVAVGVTEALAPYVWPSAMLGLPAGIFAGAVAFPFTYFGLTYREERREPGRASAVTRRQLRTLGGGAAGFVVGWVSSTAALSTQGVGLATAMILVGVPVGLFSAVAAGSLAFHRSPPDRRPPGSTVQ